MSAEQTANKNQPAIRFKGFSGEWVERKLLDNFEKIIDFRGRTPKKLGLNWSNSGYLALSALNVKNGYIDFNVDANYGDQELYDAWMTGNELHKNQVLFTTEAPMGNVAQVPDNNKYILSQRTIAFQVKPQLLEESFLAVMLRSNNVFTKLSSLSSGGTAKGVSQKSLAGVDIRVPKDTTEQTQIGACFQQLDRLIAQHQQKHDKLKKIKKALLEKMFPQQGASQPQIRFKGFTGDWEEVSLSDVITFVNGRAYSQDELLSKGKYPVLRVGNFYTNSAWYYSDMELGEKYYANKGDLLYTWSASFGPHIWSGETVIYHYHIWKLLLTSKVERDFLLHVLNKDRDNILSGSNGSTMIHITKEGMEKKRTFIPQSKEQTQIGNFFQQLDKLINQQQAQLTKLNNIKQSLLSKMFV